MGIITFICVVENRKSFSELAEANVVSGGAHMNGHESQMHQSKSTGERELVDLASEGHGAFYDP